MSLRARIERLERGLEWWVEDGLPSYLELLYDNAMKLDELVRHDPSLSEAIGWPMPKDVPPRSQWPASLPVTIPSIPGVRPRLKETAKPEPVPPPQPPPPSPASPAPSDPASEPPPPRLRGPPPPKPPEPAPDPQAAPFQPAKLGMVRWRERTAADEADWDDYEPGEYDTS